MGTERRRIRATELRASSVTRVVSRRSGTTCTGDGISAVTAFIAGGGGGGGSYSMTRIGTAISGARTTTLITATPMAPCRTSDSSPAQPSRDGAVRRQGLKEDETVALAIIASLMCTGAAITWMYVLKLLPICDLFGNRFPAKLESAPSICHAGRPDDEHNPQRTSAVECRCGIRRGTVWFAVGSPRRVGTARRRAAILPSGRCGRARQCGRLGGAGAVGHVDTRTGVGSRRGDWGPRPGGANPERRRRLYDRGALRRGRPTLRAWIRASGVHRSRRISHASVRRERLGARRGAPPPPHLRQSRRR